jgi:hypothetical protein
VGWALLGAGWAVVDACGATDVSAGPVAGLRGHASKTTGTATVAAAAVMSAIRASFVRYHGGGGDLNVNELMFEARSWPFTVHVLTVGEATRRGGGEGARYTTGGGA